jgi:hypothetical protein
MLVELKVTLNVLDTEDDAKFVPVKLAREIALGAVTEALEFAESRGFPAMPETHCMTVIKVEEEGKD